MDVEISHLVEVTGDVTEEGTGTEKVGNSKRKRKVNRNYIDDWYDGDEPKKAKQDGNETGEVYVGLLQKNRSERLNSNKQDKEAKRGAMQEMLKNWKEKNPCQRCSSLQKELKELEEKLIDKEKSIAALNE